MAASKASATIIAAGTTNVSGATITGTAVDLTTKYGAFITGLLTNGSTGPSTPATAYVEVSLDGTAGSWKTVYQVTNTLAANAMLPWSYDVSIKILYVRVRVTGNTVQTTAAEAFAHILNS